MGKLIGVSDLNSALMATGNQVIIREDYFYCSICLEIYDTPRTLPCLHTFCHSCLTGYIQKISDKPGNQNLFCPVCRTETKTDNVEFKQVEKWVEYFPINLTLLSILKEKKSTMNPEENNCDPCLREEIKVKAVAYCYDCSEKLCEECRRHHKKNKSSSNHKVSDVTHTGEYSNLCLTELEYFASLSKCPRHSSEEVKYLCKDHDQLCCNECAIVTHRKCEDLVSLAEEVNEQEKDKSDIQKGLENFGNDADKLIGHEIKIISELDTKEEEVKFRLNDFKVNFDDAYRKLETRILSEMSTKKQVLSKASSLQREHAEKLKDDISQSAEKLKKSFELGTAMHKFLLERKMEKQIKEYEERFTQLCQQTSITTFTIAETNLKQEAVKVVQDLFRIEETTIESHLSFIPRGKDFKERKMTLINEFDLQVSSQPRYCLWMEIGIVIAFEYESKLCVYNSKDGSLLTSYACPSRPTALVEIENGELAVSLPLSNKIDILKTDWNQISYVRLLVNSASGLITYNKQSKQLFTMSRSENVIRKFTLDGKDAGKIDLSSIKRNYIGSAYNLFLDSKFNHIYISSHSSSALICIDLSGKLLYQYDIQHPWSVITDSEGNVYIASYANNYVHQLSPDGRLLRKVISDSDNQHPMGMSFSKEMDKMVLTCANSKKGLKIYKFE